MSIELSKLEAHLWKFANINSPYGPEDAADFKTCAFPLLFFKPTADVYDEELSAAQEESGSAMEFAVLTHNHWFPEGEEVAA